MHPFNHSPSAPYNPNSPAGFFAGTTPTPFTPAHQPPNVAFAPTPCVGPITSPFAAAYPPPQFAPPFTLTGPPISSGPAPYFPDQLNLPLDNPSWDIVSDPIPDTCDPGHPNVSSPPPPAFPSIATDAHAPFQFGDPTAIQSARPPRTSATLPQRRTRSNISLPRPVPPLLNNDRDKKTGRAGKPKCEYCRTARRKVSFVSGDFS
jgi:hypothetical protein